MPPWPASDLSVPFQHSMKLSDEDLQSLQDWAAAGGKLDVDPSTKIEVPAEKVIHPRADITLKADEPYQGSTDNTNDYRCFILDPGVRQAHRGHRVRVRARPEGVVHHALVYRMSADSKAAVEQRDANDPGSGYGCYGGVGADLGRSTRAATAAAPTSSRVGHRASSRASTPTESALQLQPGQYFVVQIHYHFVHFAPHDQSSLVLQLGDKDADHVRQRQGDHLSWHRPRSRAGRWSRDRSAIAAPCCRTSASKYGPTGPIIADGLNLVCGTKPEQIGILVDQIA